MGNKYQWDVYARCIDQVYSPRVTSAKVILGTCLEDGDLCGNSDPAALWFTLNEENRTLDVRSENDASNPTTVAVTEVHVQFAGLDPANLGDRAVLNLECEVVPDEESGMLEEQFHSWRTQVSGQVLAWDYLNDQWTEIETVEYEPFDSERKYRFYVPDVTTRRTFAPFVLLDLAPETGRQLVDSEGIMTLKLIHTAPRNYGGVSPLAYFDSRYDLVQVYHHDEVPLTPESGPTGGGEGASMMGGGESGSSEGQAAGLAAARPSRPWADLNHDGVTDAADAAVFAAAYAAGTPRADYNADGEVDELDLLHFQGAYAAARAFETALTQQPAP